MQAAYQKWLLFFGTSNRKFLKTSIIGNARRDHKQRFLIRERVKLAGVKRSRETYFMKLLSRVGGT
jgi:hypothetical protein